ncbi:helix-turn-helix transcriptional regulator [Nesterenkonia flava]|uniref:Helix-turn-helix transcriptional regulator n=1 Tax=Nesterenkonia flava TaxID=469799 RepID=A0ABU1FW45_9MICC|nr:helix-turn-helix transcriptional regulator [Nesterenkonia flava]MDR5712346.1 helix-turn-helix transcriptional regulator [Nesterenkonia flava]
MPPDNTPWLHPVKSHRKSLRLTQAELGQRVGVSRQTIVALERGDYAPSVFLALRIARVLGSTVEDLFGQAEEAGRQPREGTA